MNSLAGYGSDSDDDSFIGSSAERQSHSTTTTHNNDDNNDSDSDFEQATELQSRSLSSISSFSIESAPALSDSDSDDEDDTSSLFNSTHKPQSALCEAGVAQRTYVPEYMFRDNFNKFMNKGEALDPSLQSLHKTTHVFSGPVTLDSIQNQAKIDTVEDALVHYEIQASDKQTSKRKKAQKTNFDASSSSFTGSWGKYEGEEESQKPTLTKEQEENMEAYNNKKSKPVEADVVEVTTFHGEALTNYLGKSFLAPPPGFKYHPELLNCYIPEKRNHTWAGHSKGVSSVNFFPKIGHYVLSSSMDTSIKLWSTTGDKRCIQTYMGHKEAVRQADFNLDGSQFVSVSYDKYSKIWDTETGNIVFKTKHEFTPLCAHIHPHKPDEVIIGTSRGVIVQLDTRSGDVIQEYKDHMSAVNSITFFDDANKFMSSSDDKKLFIYDYGVPVVIKQIFEPDLHSIPSMAVHPSGKYIVGNSQDNQVLVFAAGDKIKLNRRKRFTGHLTGGFACGLSFSPDGHYLASGDAEGRIFYWDFKTGRMLKKVKAHNQVTIDVKWHPSEAGKLVSCSWDGTMKYWV